MGNEVKTQQKETWTKQEIYTKEVKRFTKPVQETYKTR